jgi:ferredoxin
MIFYFSATGNCKYVAKRIADATGDEIQSIQNISDDTILSDHTIGIISPTYNYTLPVITRDFLMKVKLSADYLYYVAAYGTSPGGSDRHAAKFLGRPFDAYFSVKMPDTWTPTYDLSTPEKIAKFTKTTEADIDRVIRYVKEKHNGQFMDNRKNTLIAFIGKCLYEDTRKTKHLYVTEDCIGCGLCAKKCPVQAIEIREKKPVWVKDKCMMCLGCLHRCPKFAIQYDRGNTKEHGQYKNPYVKV